MTGYDAAIYKVHETEPVEIEAAGSQVHLVVPHFQFKKTIPGQ